MKDNRASRRSCPTNEKDIFFVRPGQNPVIPAERERKLGLVDASARCVEIQGLNRRIWDDHRRSDVHVAGIRYGNINRFEASTTGKGADSNVRRVCRNRDG